jgi:hypothetical protein
MPTALILLFADQAFLTIVSIVYCLHDVRALVIWRLPNQALRDMMNLKIYVDVEADRRILRVRGEGW